MKNRWAEQFKADNDLTKLDRSEKLAVFLVLAALVSLGTFIISTVVIFFN